MAFQGRYTVTDTYDGPEYEAVAGFGSNCAIFDIELVARANELCNEVGIDVISTAGTVAFVMECVEHGLLGEADLHGVDLRFGNGEALLEAIPLIAERKGIGELLALGSRRIAEQLGGEALTFAMQVKGLELAMHEPRGKVGVALGYATNEAGADHLVGFHDPIFVNPDSVPFKGAMGFGVTEPADVFTLGETKVQNWFLGERWNAAEKVLGFCFFGPVPRSFIQAEDVVAAVRAATGWDVGVGDVLEFGERAVNMARMFNVREGLSRRDDRLPARLHAPLEGGPLTGRSIDPEAFEEAVTRLYKLKGWDPATGQPTAERLRALGLEWTMDAQAGVG
jgi:aldehyde:ferredoxin oxidoreductase